MREYDEARGCVWIIVNQRNKSYLAFMRIKIASHWTVAVQTIPVRSGHKVSELSKRIYFHYVAEEIPYDKKYEVVLYDSRRLNSSDSGLNLTERYERSGSFPARGQIRRCGAQVLDNTKGLLKTRHRREHKTVIA